MQPFGKFVDRDDDKKVNGEGRYQKRKQVVQEIAVKELRAVHAKSKFGKIRLIEYRGDERGHEVFHERGDDAVECSADHDAHREVYDAAAQDELLESLEHVLHALSLQH